VALKSYRELEVWQVAVEMVELVYRITEHFPPDERFGLISQMRRSAVSVPSNIAEGYGRRTRPDYCRHLSIAQGSLCELETQLIIAGRLGMFDRERATPLWDRMQKVGQMLHRLQASLAKPDPGPRNPDPA